MPNASKRPRGAHIKLKLYPVTEAAEILGCSSMHVYRLISTGELSAVNIATPGAKGIRGSKTRIRHDDLLDYIERRTRVVQELRHSTV